MWAMSDDGVDPDGFPPAGTHVPPRAIKVEIHDRPDGTFRMAIQHSEPDPAWVSRALRLAADAVLIEESGPAITPAGHLMERETGWGIHEAE